MKGIFTCLVSIVLSVESIIYENVTYQPAQRQLLDYKLTHPIPGLWTKLSGDPTEIRETLSINSDQFNNQLLVDAMSTVDGENLPERVVHAKGTGAFGYFEVTNDVSKYTYADVFNGIGKKTPVVVRLSISIPRRGSSDTVKDIRGFAVKFYTKDGNLDFTCLQTPVYFCRDPIVFPQFVRACKMNPQTGIREDFTAPWDFITLNPLVAHNFFWTLSDYGVPDGYRRMDAFPIHVYEIANKDGERHYVKFSFRTEQGFSSLNKAQAAAIQSKDLDYFHRDLYNAIARGDFPAWKLEMDVMTVRDIQHVDYDPFDVTRLWKNGTYTTVQIGRLVLNKNIENQFRDLEQAVFNPGHLVPGIPGPVDFLFRGRRFFYRDTQNYRLGRNHNNILVNQPLYQKTYARDGKPPTNLNMGNAPYYHPNSFNGPMPYVDEKRPSERLQVLESHAVDLEPVNNFYNYILEDEAHRRRFIGAVVDSLKYVSPSVLKKALKLFHLIDRDFGARVALGLQVALAQVRTKQEAASPSGPIRSVPSAAPVIKHVPVKNVYKKYT